ncbi:hypothetical protein OOK44_12310 [Streptomyces cellulosae]|uniref:Uncharacterized protein n=2 Tax=Streptomyces TaxID=1883 RepID=A0ABU3J9T4_9ACTN|nr:hypothetical protein [Streptomyces sp. McG7]MBT2908281.1 hypothetical protein [Streptomyces sp. McG8]MCX4477229.1 hypothetical protein [Streptomyces cellulosae]MDQ0488335.1 hypothetical protein [Streptomyces thermodiastaticus]MDT6971816.1 hypothetical protein [Streptomyces thermocarboxydus]MXQ57446.1 hypothetical protein [Streptomyces sp. XHT-2]MYQ31471.1 hypothetical protein [Streptomyces sp. SID4956]THC55789.1 hypothetical protein E7X38_16670 [Streptomyces sp. Akac8]
MPTASAPPSDLRLAITGTKRDGNPNVIDEIGDAYRIPLAPVFIFGAAGIWERMELDVDLRPVPVVSSPLFGASPTGPRTFKLMKKTATEDWSPRRRGHWSGKNIDVRVDHVDKGPELRFSPRHFIVSVDDQTPGWALQYSKECVLDGTEMPDGLLHTFVDSFSMATPADGGDGRGPEEAVRAAAEAVYSAAKPSGARAIQRSPSDADVTRIAMELSDRARSFGLRDSRILKTIPGAMAALMNQATFTMFPSSGTTLQLFEVQVNQQPVDTVLRYVRTTPDGRVFVDEYLSWYQDLG